MGPRWLLVSACLLVAGCGSENPIDPYAPPGPIYGSSGPGTNRPSSPPLPPSNNCQVPNLSDAGTSQYYFDGGTDVCPPGQRNDAGMSNGFSNNPLLDGGVFF